MRRATRGSLALRLLGVLLLVSGFVTTVEVGPASAATPTVSVSPTSVQDGDQVTVDLQGFDANQILVALVCPSSYASGPGGHADALSQCGLLGVAPSGSSALHSTVAIHDQNKGIFGAESFTCSALPDGCVIAGANTP